MVRVASDMGLQAKPNTIHLPDSTVRFIVIHPARARKDMMDKEHAAKINSEILRVGLVYDGLEPSEHAWKQYQVFPTPLNDPYGNSWWPVKPYRMTNSRVRLEFVSNIDRFLSEETEIEDRLAQGCIAAIEKILNYR